MFVPHLQQKTIVFFVSSYKILWSILNIRSAMGRGVFDGTGKKGNCLFKIGISRGFGSETSLAKERVFVILPFVLVC